MNGMQQGGQPYKTESISFDRQIKILNEEGDVEITIKREDKQIYKYRDFRVFFMAHQDTAKKMEDQISEENIEKQKSNIKEIKKSVSEIEPTLKESEEKYIEYHKKKDKETQINLMKKALEEKKIEPKIENNLVNVWKTLDDDSKDKFTNEEKVKMAKMIAKHK